MSLKVLEGVTTIRMLSTDIHGISRAFFVDKNFSETHHKEGIPQIGCMSVLFGINGELIHGTGVAEEVDYKNAVVYPEVATIRRLPWKPACATVMVDFRKLFNDPASQMLSTLPRNICKQQVERLKADGMKLKSAFEYEFYILREKDLTSASPLPDLCNLNASLWCEELMDEVMQAMKEQGIRPEMWNQEYGPGQVELTTLPEYDVEAADNAIRTKQTVKEVARKHGYRATFMSKVYPEYSGSSGHYNHSLWSHDDETNLFYDQSTGGMSPLMQHWVAGLREHAPALQALLCHTTNCYTRINAGFFNPVNTAWGMDNRTCAFRMKTLGPRQTYVENRVPGAASNPYLVVAGNIIAGLDGVRRKLTLPPPTTGDAAHASGERPLPKSLEEALQCLEKSELFREQLGDEFIKAYVANKMEEVSVMKAVPENEREEWARKYYSLAL